MSDVLVGSNLLTNSYGEAFAQLVRGEGCHVWDADGKRYLDFLSGIAVNALAHPHQKAGHRLARHDPSCGEGGDQQLIESGPFPLPRQPHD